MDTLPVLIVGSGPTGLTMAAELARRKIPCRIIEKLAVRSPYSRALTVHARTLELLQKMGLAPKFLERGFSNLKVGLYVRGKRRFGLNLEDIGIDDTPYPFILFLSQAETERLLEAHCETLGVKVEYGCELVELRQEPDKVVAMLKRDGTENFEEVHCEYVVGCDGAHSKVRRALHMDFAGGAYPHGYLLIDAHIEWPKPMHGFAGFLGSRGFMAHLPLDGDRLGRLVMLQPPGEQSPDMGEPTLEEVERIASEHCGLRLKLSEPRWISRFYLHHRGVERYSDGRCFLAGDAAHIHSPAGGQGMNTGIQDAFNLAWKLALVVSRRADVSLLETYQSERHPVGRHLLRGTDRMFRFMSTGHRPTIFFRNLLLPLFLRLMTLTRSRRRRLFRFVSQIGIRYRQSRLTMAAKDAATPQPGERAPDVRLQRRDYWGVWEETTLFAQMGGVEIQLLCFQDDELTLGELQQWRGDLDKLLQLFPGQIQAHWITRRAAETIDTVSQAAHYVDSTGESFKRYGFRRSGVVLVRPDGYVACRGFAADLPTFAAHLQLNGFVV